jgi:hypothetical protein
MLDLDLLKHPELVELCHKAVVDAHRAAHEDYKDIPLPFARKQIIARQVAARKEAIRCYCENKGLQAHEVMAKMRPQNNDTI